MPDEPRHAPTAAELPPAARSIERSTRNLRRLLFVMVVGVALVIAVLLAVYAVWGLS